MNFAILDAILKNIFLLNFQVLLSDTASLENPALAEYYCSHMARKGRNASSSDSRHKIMCKKCEMIGEVFCSGLQRNYRRFTDCC